jgi:release factor glutamine methyltransferase
MRCDRTYFYAHPEQELTEIHWIHYGRYLHERKAGKPTQYITGKQEFYGRDFKVTPAVLIPRPETELVVEAVLKRLKDGRVADVGTGSGAIAITLARESQLEVIATDISPEALATAKQNCGRDFSRVSFLQTDLLAAIAPRSLDAVISNPPYVPERDRETLQPEVRDWEPHQALFAGPDGLDIYRRLIPEAERVLKPGGLLAMEIGLGQAEAVKALLANWQNVQIEPDLAGISRVVLARIAP